MSHNDKSIIAGVDERVKTGLLKLHSDFLKKNLPSKKFNFSYVEAEESALAYYLSAKKISWKDALEMAGLSYDHHRGQLIYGKTDDERKETFKLLISHIVELSNGNFGVLSDIKMNVGDHISLPRELLISPDHSVCEDAGCRIFTTTKKSVYATGRRIFGDWYQAISACGIDYQSVVLKKIASPTVSLEFLSVIINLGEIFFSLTA